MKVMETPVFAGVFIFFAAPRVSGARDAADPIIESLRLVAILQVRATSCSCRRRCPQQLT